jgi:hypothetical protein
MCQQLYPEIAGGLSEAEAEQGAANCISEIAIATNDAVVCDYLQLEYFADYGTYHAACEGCVNFSDPNANVDSICG